MGDIHIEIAPLAFLIGTWSGRGRGDYPTVDEFEYLETATFIAPPGKAFLFYQQKTARGGDHPEAGNPLHAEVGYVRPAPDRAVEMVVAQPTGITEVLHGSVDGHTVALRSTAVQTTATAKHIETTERVISVDGDRMAYRLSMGAVGQPHQLHLTAELWRES